jgi:hypothetical protein
MNLFTELHNLHGFGFFKSLWMIPFLQIWGCYPVNWKLIFAFFYYPPQPACRKASQVGVGKNNSGHKILLIRATCGAMKTSPAGEFFGLAMPYGRKVKNGEKKSFDKISM